MNNMVNVEFCLGGLLSVYSMLCIMVTSDWGCLHCVVILYPMNLPDPIQKCLAYGQLWPLQPVCSQNQAG